MKKLFISRGLITKVKGGKKSIAIEVMKPTSVEEIGDIDVLFFERENGGYGAYGVIKKNDGFDIYHIGSNSQEVHLTNGALNDYIKAGLYSMAGYTIDDAVKILCEYTDYSGEFFDFVEDAEKYLKNKNKKSMKEETKTPFRTNVEVHYGDADIIVKFNKEQDYDAELKFAEKVQEFANNLYEQMFHEEDEFAELINNLQGKSTQDAYDALMKALLAAIKKGKYKLQ